MRYLLALALGTLVVGDPQACSGSVALVPPPASLGGGLAHILGTSGAAPLAARSALVSVQAPATPEGAPARRVLLKS